MSAVLRDFEGRVALLTGAAGNLGRAVAQAFAARGARLVLVDRRREDLEAAFGNDARVGPDPLLLPLDLLDASAVAQGVGEAVARCGRLDILANLAGGFRMGEPVHATSGATLEFLLDLNVRTLLNATHAVVPHLLAAGGGRIVNVGAFSAQRGLAQQGAYIASKSAVIRLTEAMSAELREQGVNVNCVLPTTLDTPANRAAMPDADPRRFVALDDLAQVIVFLASDAARAVHGAALPVTGLG